MHTVYRRQGRWVTQLGVREVLESQRCCCTEEIPVTTETCCSQNTGSFFMSLRPERLRSEWGILMRHDSRVFSTQFNDQRALVAYWPFQLSNHADSWWPYCSWVDWRNSFDRGVSCLIDVLVSAWCFKRVLLMIPPLPRRKHVFVVVLLVSVKPGTCYWCSHCFQSMPRLFIFTSCFVFRISVSPQRCCAYKCFSLRSRVPSAMRGRATRISCTGWQCTFRLHLMIVPANCASSSVNGWTHFFVFLWVFWSCFSCYEIRKPYL